MEKLNFIIIIQEGWDVTFKRKAKKRFIPFKKRRIQYLLICCIAKKGKKECISKWIKIIPDSSDVDKALALLYEKMEEKNLFRKLSLTPA